MFRIGSLIAPTEEFFNVLRIHSKHEKIDIRPFMPDKDTICTVETIDHSPSTGYLINLVELRSYREDGTPSLFVARLWREVLPPQTKEESEELTNLINQSIEIEQLCPA